MNLPSNPRQWKLNRRREQILEKLQNDNDIEFEQLVQASRLMTSATRAETCRKQTARIVAELLEAGTVTAIVKLK